MATDIFETASSDLLGIARQFQFVDICFDLRDPSHKRIRQSVSAFQAAENFKRARIVVNCFISLGRQRGTLRQHAQAKRIIALPNAVVRIALG